MLSKVVGLKSELCVCVVASVCCAVCVVRSAVVVSVCEEEERKGKFNGRERNLCRPPWETKDGESRFLNRVEHKD